jgi:hypothetical protein
MIYSFIQTTNRNESSIFNCITYVCVYVCYPDGKKKKKKKKKIDDCCKTMWVCVKLTRLRMYVISSNIDSFLSFFSFFLLLFSYSYRFFLSVLCYTFNCTKRKRNAVTTSASAELPKYLSSHHHHRYASIT